VIAWRGSCFFSRTEPRLGCSAASAQILKNSFCQFKSVANTVLDHKIMFQHVPNHFPTFFILPIVHIIDFSTLML